MESTDQPAVRVAAPVWRMRSIVVLLAVTAAGCATQPPVNGDGVREVARFYWPYAALAADVYRTRGEVDTNTAMALASPWLRAKVDSSGNDATKASFRRLGFPEANWLYRQQLQQRCLQERAQDQIDEKDSMQPPSCIAEDDARREEKAAADANVAEPNYFVADEPRESKDCEYNSGHQPRVPVAAVKEGTQGWTRVPELQKQAAVRAWRLFVPELAIDVWRRERQALGQPLEMEYAIVYRGTVGGGGWMSNLRGLTAMLPFVWDQYRQADLATDAIIDQVARLHVVADSLLRPSQPTRLRFTAVGHSLGGGLAQYIYLRTPRITRVVAFDSSPIDGSSTIQPDRRAAVTTAGRRAVDLDPRDNSAAFHLLFEKGEFISLFAPCHSGPLWGDEGGPWVRCESVNFSHGNAFRQHNMAQLACHLFLAQRELSPTTGYRQ